MLKLKLVLASLVSILPINALRVMGYRLLGYKVQGKIGFGTIIAVTSAHIAKCRIGTFNLFVGPMKVVVAEGVSIGARNTFACGFWTVQKEHREKGYARSLMLGKESLITSGHYFDLAGSFTLDERSWVAGTGSQFWTHGAGVRDRDIVIGKDCYLGSAVRFAPGTAIGDHNIVALGSVVTKKFTLSTAMIAGVPARVVIENYDWKEDLSDLDSSSVG